MAANVEMQGIEFQIINDSEDASKGLEKLSSALENLKSSIGGSGTQLSKAAEGIRQIKNALNDVKLSSFTKNIKSVADSLKPLGELKFNSITKFIGEVNKLNSSKLLLISQIDFSNLKEAADAAKVVSGVSGVKSRVSSATDEIPRREFGNVEIPQVTVETTQEYEDAKQKAQELKDTINSTNSVDAFIAAKSDLDVLKMKLSEVKTKIEELRKEGGDNAPGLASLVERAQKLQAQINEATKPVKDMTEAMNDAEILIHAKSDVDILKMRLDEAKVKLAELIAEGGDNAPGVANLLEKIKKLQEQIDNAGKSVEKTNHRFKDFLKSLKRIAMYRAARSIISGITSTVKEGIQNLARYSSALDGTDSSGLNNTLSQYAAKLLELKNAIGAAIAPMLQALLPAFNTIAERAVKAANAINQFFSAMNGQTTYTKAIYNAVDYADSLNGAADAASKLKKSVMGFDELNILPDTSSVGTGSYGVVYEDMFEEEEIGSGMQEFGKWVKDNLQEIITMIGGVWLAIKAVKVVSWATNVMKKLKALKILDKVKNLKTNLTGVQKGAIVAVAALAEFATIKSAVKDLTSGCEDVGTKIAEIGVAATAAGAVMYAVMGPAGIAVAAVVGLTAAIVGVKAAQMEMMETLGDEAFYSGTGTKISTLAEEYGYLMENVTKAYQPLLDSKDELDGIKESAGNAADEIMRIAASIEQGATSATESLPEIEKQFGDFSINVQSAMEEIYNSVITALSGSFGAALLANGASMGEILTTLSAMKKSGDDTFSGLMSDYENLNEKLASGTITDTEFAHGLSEITEKMGALIGVSSEVGDVFGNLKDAIGNIDWENDTAVSDFFNSVTESAKNAKDSINESYDYLIDNLKTIRDSWNLSPELKLVADEWIATAEADRNAQLASVDSQLTALFDAVQADAILKMQNLEDSLKKKWSEMNWFEKLFWDNEAEYVNSGLNEYSNKHISDISERINESFEQLKIDGSAWATDTVNEILDAAFDYSAAFDKWSFAEDLSDAIDSGFEKIGVSGASDAASAGKEISESFKEALNNGLKGTYFGKISYELEPIPGLHGHSITGYATGGFPTAGELFIANEAGAEMVGSIGGHTAVANNDQIETALENAAYRGVRAAMSEGGGANGGGQTRVIIATVDGRVLYETVVDEARSDTLRTGYNRLVEV